MKYINNINYNKKEKIRKLSKRIFLYILVPEVEIILVPEVESIPFVLE
jgi:hypothetical protein